MIDVSNLQEKYSIDELSQKKTTLETELSEAHTKPNVNISALSAELSFITELYKVQTELLNEISAYQQAQEILSDGTDTEMVEMANLEISELEEKIPETEKTYKNMLIAHKLADPDDMKSVIMEIRAGAGGEEASLFAADLFRMYQNYANNNGWKLEILSTSVSENGGYKEVIAKVVGKNAFKHLKYESGVHRVQRIPVTESGGRIHTSTASVAILPEAKDIDIQIKPEDIRIDTMRASGAGGQCVNKTDSAIRITHMESGIVVSCQDTKHQAQNREKAMDMLRSRLYERKRSEEAQKRSDMRTSQIGTGMRSEKIRTYNYPQSRITDHRVKISWHNLETFMNGEIAEPLNELNEAMLQTMLDELEKSEKAAKPLD